MLHTYFIIVSQPFASITMLRSAHTLPQHAKSVYLNIALKYQQAFRKKSSYRAQISIFIKCIFCISLFIKIRSIGWMTRLCTCKLSLNIWLFFLPIERNRERERRNAKLSWMVGFIFGCFKHPVCINKFIIFRRNATVRNGTQY